MVKINTSLAIAMIIIVGGGGIVVTAFYSQPILEFLHLANAPTTSSPPNFYSNKTVYSYANQTQEPPLMQPSTTLLGGNQYVGLHFTMQTYYNSSSYQYYGVHFVGEVVNFTGSSLSNPQNIPIQNSTSVNFNTSFALTPKINDPVINNYNPTPNDSFLFPGITNYDGHILPNATSSVTAGDITGQGQDELIASYYVQCLNQWGSELSILKWDSLTQSFKPWTSNISLGLYYPSVLAFNARGTGPDQIVVAGFSSLDTSYITLKFINFSPNGNTVTNDSQRTITTSTLLNLEASPGELILEKGDVYGYGPQQFLIYGSRNDGFRFAALYTYDLSNGTIILLHQWVGENLGRPLLTPFLTSGPDQIVIPCLRTCGTNSNNPVYGSYQAGFIYGDAQLNFSKLAYFPYAGIIGGGNVLASGKTVLVMISQGPSNTILMTLFEYESSYEFYNTTSGLYNAYPILETQNGNQLLTQQYDISYSSSQIGPYLDQPVLISDITFDSIPEIILPDMDTTLTGAAIVYFMRQNTLAYSGPLFDTFYPATTAPISTYGDFQYIGSPLASTVGDFFGQAVKLIHEDTYVAPSNPTIMAVLAAPPIVSATAQDPGNSFTQLGKSQASETTQEQSFNWNIGGSIGLGVKTAQSAGVLISELVSEVSVEARLSFTYSHTTSSAKTQSLKISTSWATDGKHNAVVFSAILYKHWNYTAINGPLNGTQLVFSYPLTVSVQEFDLQTFDQLFPQYNLGNGTLGQQQIGHPETYPTKSQISTITTGSPFMYESSQIGVGEGGDGYQTVQIDVSQQTSTTYSHAFTLGESLNSEVVLGDLLLTASVSSEQSWGFASTITIGSGTSYYGQIANIPNYKDWQQYQYNFGLFTYVLNRKDIGISYQVINYWTQPFGPAFQAIGQHPAQNLLSAFIEPMSPTISTMSSNNNTPIPLYHNLLAVNFLEHKLN